METPMCRFVPACTASPRRGCERKVSFVTLADVTLAPFGRLRVLGGPRCGLIT